MKNQRGEIVTILTVISLGLMLMGIVAGKLAVQQTTQTQSRADNPDGCKNNPEVCDPNTETCIDNRCKPKKTEVPNAVPPTSAPDTQPPKATDVPPTPDKKTDSCLNCSHGEGCSGSRWCGNDCQYHDDLNYQCNGSLKPSPTGPKGCGPGEGCKDGRYCGNDGSWHDENNYICSLPPSPTGPRGCGPKEGCVSGGRYCGNDGVFHDELNYPKGCTGGTIGALPPTATPKISPGSIKVGTYCDPTEQPVPDQGKCFFCNSTTGKWNEDKTNKQCQNTSPTLGNPTPTPAVPTPILTPAYHTFAGGAIPECNTTSQIPCGSNKDGSGKTNISGCTGHYYWNDIGSGDRFYGPFDAPEKACSDLASHRGSPFVTYTPSPAAPTPRRGNEPQSYLPQPGLGITSYDWSQVQTLATAGKVQADQISAWVYEAAQYYYPGIKMSFCNPMKRECDFRL